MAKIHNLENDEGALVQEIEQDRVFRAVAGRRAVGSLHLTYTKSFLPINHPGVDYTKFEIDRANTDFFNDKTNELAQTLLQELANRESNDLVVTIRENEKLFCTDNSLFHNLKKMHHLQQVIEYTKAIGAFSDDDDSFEVEKIAMVLLEKDESYILSVTPFQRAQNRLKHQFPTCSMNFNKRIKNQ